TVKHFGRHIPAELRTALDLGGPPDFDGVICVDCGTRHHIQYDHVDPVAFMSRSRAPGGLAHPVAARLRSWLSVDSPPARRVGPAGMT
ncbi:MAG TPA: hypothetical protein VGF64_04245, partial [Acidimicrobiales bacterium]